MTPDRQHIRPPMTPHHWLRIPQPNDSGECSTATASLRFPMLGCGSCCTATAPKHPSRRVASVVLWHPNAWFVCCCFWYIVQTKHIIYIHYITLHCITLHYITLHCITLHYITLHYITLHYITYVHTYIHAYMHTCIHAYMHTCIHAYMHTYIIWYYIISYQIILYYIRSDHIISDYIILCIYIPGNPKASFFPIIRGWHVFCHYGFVGSIEGPIWRTQIRSVNAREVEKNLWVFMGFL